MQRHCKGTSDQGEVNLRRLARTGQSTHLTTTSHRWRSVAAALILMVAITGLTCHNSSKVRTIEMVTGCVHPHEDIRLLGIRFASQRPVLDTIPACDEAVRTVDAGWCFRGRMSPAYCLPSLIVGGAQKAATGWLRQWLGRHPELSQGGEHEIHYFDNLPRDKPLKDWATSYLRAFPTHSSTVYTFEKTPDYLPNVTALVNIRALLPSVKLVFLLRNPTARAYSAFQHHCRRLRFGSDYNGGQSTRLRSILPGSSGVVFSLETSAEQWAKVTPLVPPCSPIDFDSFVTPRLNSTRIITWGLYAQQLGFVGFPHSQLYVAFAEPALAEPNAFLDHVVSWLGLRRFDFAKLPTYVDVLGRTQLKIPGLYGIWHRVYSEIGLYINKKHNFAPLLHQTKLRLDTFYLHHNRQLNTFLLYAAPEIAVFPPRHGKLHNDSGRRNVDASAALELSLLPPSWPQ